ncbi:ankyrin repeat domain-containing protein [Actinomycetes bacterium KLBMP 9759]
MPALPDHPSLEHLRKQAKALRRERAVPLHAAQREVARSYGFASWPRLTRFVEADGLGGIRRALALADPALMRTALDADRGAATAPVDGLPPLLALLRDSAGAPSDIRACAELLLDAGADPESHTVEWGGEGRRTALFDAVERADAGLVRLLVERGATKDEDAFYHACEQSDLVMLDLLWVPGHERLVNHKLDFEDEAGLRWFLARGVDVNAEFALHHAIVRGRGRGILTMLLDAGADMNLPWCRWDVGRRPLALAARAGHLDAYELLAARGAEAELDVVDAAVLAVARGESAQLPSAPPPAPGIPAGTDYGWVLGQFALLGRLDVVRALLDAGLDVDTRGWSNFTPLDQAAMNGRTDVVRLLVERGADLADRAFDDEGPTPLDCAIWGMRNNPAADGDHLGTVRLLVEAGAPTRHIPPTGDPRIDELLAN